jgi:hypothetical protein
VRKGRRILGGLEYHQVEYHGSELLSIYGQACSLVEEVSEQDPKENG